MIPKEFMKQKTDETFGLSAQNANVLHVKATKPFFVKDTVKTHTP